MDRTENDSGFSKKFIEESKKIEEGLKKVTEKLIAETKATKGLLNCRRP